MIMLTITTMNSKKRRHDGRKIIDVEFEDGIDYRETYDEWNNHRDSFRPIGVDKTHKQKNIRIVQRMPELFTKLSKINKKIKKMSFRRKKIKENRKLYI